MTGRPLPWRLTGEPKSLATITPVPPFLGWAEFVANPLPGGGPPPTPDHLVQLDGFAITQLDGSLILII